MIGDSEECVRLRRSADLGAMERGVPDAPAASLRSGISAGDLTARLGSAGLRRDQLKRKAEVQPDASHAVAEAVADTDSRVFEDPQPARHRGTHADSHLELIRHFQWTLPREGELR